MNNQNMHLVINVVLFQATWFSLVMGPLLLAGVLLVSLVIHAGLSSENLKREIGFALCVVCFGVISDSLMRVSNVYTLPSSSLFGQYLIPSWLMLLWVAFSFSLKHSLNWMFGMPKLMLLLLMIAGPVSYYAGSQLNSDRIQIEYDLMHWMFIQWAVLALIIFGLHLAFYRFKSREEHSGY
jgi:hypothetical protein